MSKVLGVNRFSRTRTIFYSPHFTRPRARPRPRTRVLSNNSSET
jgi:hypothetical protein